MLFDERVMASLDAAYLSLSGSVAATIGLRHRAVLEEAMQLIGSAISVSGPNRWPLACLQESSGCLAMGQC